MKRIALSLVSIVAALAVVAGVTTAIFSDSKSIVGNSVATGTLKLTLNHSAGKPWAVSGMKPGDVTGWEYMDVFNGPYPPVAGQLPFEAYFRLENPVGDVPLYNALEIDLYDSGWDSNCGNGDDVQVYSGLLTGVTGGSLRTQTSDNDPNSGGTPGNDDIRPGWSQRLCQRLRLPSSVGNDLQGKSVTFDEWVDAEQNND
jgi:predicted ribosomally synthesized peptide with SipW-like signal peptide